MTAFILVPGAHTGGWIWREVADRLRESGGQAHTVTLTGMGDDAPPAGPGTDLETHIQDVVRLIDRVDAPEVVLVGHCYGVHPALGAADRRPERVARIVYVDTAVPQGGAPALELVPDQTVRELLRQRAEKGEDDGQLPPPAPDAWQSWGSVADIPEDALAQLAERAAPQPLATLTQPLLLSGAASKLPTTGILCTANGSSIAMIEMLVRLGDPRLTALTEPWVRFFELGTGHWPMLSAPDELARVLLGAAADEGYRLSPAEQPAHLRPFLLDVPERPRERVGRVDLYLPDADGPRPAVVFVHGGPVPADMRPTPRDWPSFLGYGQYVANSGAVGVTVDHRLHDLADYERAAQDVAEAIELVRADPRVDEDRVALWFFSGGSLMSADWLATPPPWLRCLAATYPVLAPLPNWGFAGSRFRPATAVRTAGRLPIVVTRVGLEMAEIAVTVEEFLTSAADCGADVEVVDVPNSHHGFETIDYTDEARHAVEHAVRSVLGHLRG
ncbi:pimeloyl-ACP methyl ester carboxylesterase [Streptomyces olivoverticillatus]|uniref:Pimeloyl-ACP methyl ester carboxylesterase n=1 Tax=Streptomyces olivoverticillatus TaxID=66427 RepID=A0A7W7PKT8_9ACTN|nr:alpha/beta fold hydrolase [Streptomyces olivoverticillatus]MBB4893584.1 pimeloyl-ACP methyl ester carboxylesterase [Streptomyces olivoverticillatus]